MRIGKIQDKVNRLSALIVGGPLRILLSYRISLIWFVIFQFYCVAAFVKPVHGDFSQRHAVRQIIADFVARGDCFIRIVRHVRFNHISDRIANSYLGVVGIGIIILFFQSFFVIHFLFQGKVFRLYRHIDSFCWQRPAIFRAPFRFQTNENRTVNLGAAFHQNEIGTHFQVGESVLFRIIVILADRRQRDIALANSGSHSIRKRFCAIGICGKCLLYRVVSYLANVVRIVLPHPGRHFIHPEKLRVLGGFVTIVGRVLIVNPNHLISRYRRDRIRVASIPVQLDVALCLVRNAPARSITIPRRPGGQGEAEGQGESQAQGGQGFQFLFHDLLPFSFFSLALLVLFCRPPGRRAAPRRRVTGRVGRGGFSCVCGGAAGRRRSTGPRPSGRCPAPRPAARPARPNRASPWACG